MTLVPNFPDNWAQPLMSLGNVHVTEKQVMTPAGTWPLAQVNVTSIDQTSTTTHTPGWAIVLVIVFIWFFLLSLLFLLARETRVQGYVAVHIQAGPQSYTEQIPVRNAYQRAEVFNRVAYLQRLIGQARHGYGI
ncbi:hypothetical protein [Arthrobacter cryoconiti]|uniref:Uncharacterized protein n=1 Tax=Arthrobacter cryoconiti TaxID=748907 RepID=A0ABV8R1H3_9MICC|nr:hypothetical protein [Arthrobacter cryoconiti]MCC9068500.1 hypothetical protein [Arthrobacter cryoconiti]